jgi:acyl carrier protein
MTMEEEFDLEIADDEAAKISTVGDIIDFLSSRLAA